MQLQKRKAPVGNGTIFCAYSIPENPFFLSNAKELNENISTIVINGHFVEGIYGQKTSPHEGRTWLYLMHLYS